MTEPVRRIVIVGGGTAGWMTAALLNRHLPPARCAITLVESPAIGTIGVGEATIPTMVRFLDAVGIPEDAFLRRCRATYKLAIRFVNWRRGDDEYWHPFGAIGGAIDDVLVFHHWHRALREGRSPGPYAAYSLHARLAARAKSPRPRRGESVVTQQRSYAYHMDAGLFAEHLAEVATARGVRRVLDDVRHVALDERGFVRHVETAGHGPLEADVFVDCSGFAGLLVERALGSPWIDWSDVLLCDRAAAIPLPPDPRMPPYTRSTALGAGWAWRIPLHHRVGCGYVYGSGFVSDDDAVRALCDHAGVDAEAAEPRRLRLRIGRRREPWTRNCVAIGLSAGFLEPLESTGLYLIQKAAELFLEHLPDADPSPVLARRYNDRLASVYEEIRDFIVLHYVASAREDTAFWRACRHVALPDSLRATLELYDETGLTGWEGRPVFHDTNFYAIAAGLERLPRRTLARALLSDGEKAWEILGHIRAQNEELARSLPDHAEILAAIHGAQAPAAL